MSTLLEQLLGLDTSLPEFNDHVSNILHGEEYRKLAKRISGTDAVRLIDFLDRALDVLDPASSGFRRCLRELKNICGERMILPTLYTPPSQVLIVGRQPVASGGSGDVYEGTLNGSKVCVKRVRVYARDGPEAGKKTLYKEAIMWKRLDHENIVPLLGITTNPLQLISEWMSGGHLTEYIGKYPNANRLSLVCDIAKGLYYLHSRNIVHGDLKGPNILVNNTGCAGITDLGLATVTQNMDSVRSGLDEHGHTARWTAPEILGEEGSHSKEADIFSFAMVMIEAFTGYVPFNHGPPAAAIIAIMKDMRPPRPTHPNFTPELWALMQRCWNRDPYLRPEASEILQVVGITNPPPTVPYFSGIGSPSTLTITQQPLPTGLTKTAAQRSPSVRNTISRSTPQISSQRSDYNSPASPVNHVGGMGMHENQGPGSYVSPQTTMQRSPSSTHHRSPSQRRGKSSGNVNRIQSRQNTEVSEVSPVLPDPGVYDPNDQFYGQTGGAGMSRMDLRNALGNKSGSKRDVGGQGSRLDLNQINLDNMGEGSHNRGASSSAVNVSGGYNRGGTSRNPSRTDLLKNASRDDLGQYETDPHDKGKSTSRLDLGGTGGGPISRQPSKKGTSKMNSYSTRNASRHELPVPHEYSETQRSQGDQVYSHTGGAGGSRAELQNPLGDRNKPRKNTVTGPDPNYDDNGEGNYWPEGRRDNRSASSSALNLGGRYNRGDTSRNPSRIDLPMNASRKHLGQPETNPLDMGKGASRHDLVNPVEGHISRQPSKREPPRVDSRTGNAPGYDPETGTKPRNQPQPGVDGPVIEQQNGPQEVKKFCGVC